MAYPIAQPRILAVMNVAMMNVVPVALIQTDRALTEPGQLAIVDLQTRMIGADPAGRRKLVVVTVPAPFGE